MRLPDRPVAPMTAIFMGCFLHSFCMDRFFYHYSRGADREGPETGAFAARRFHLTPEKTVWYNKG